MNRQHSKFGIRSVLSAAVVTGVVAISGGVAHAEMVPIGDPAKSVSQVQIDIGEWTFVPTLGDSRVESFVALRTAGTIEGSNITSVWLQRGRNNTWYISAWASQDFNDSISYIKESLGIGDRYDSRWPVDGTFDVEDPPAPIPFRNGLFHDDPMQDVLDSVSDPRALLESLVHNG